MYSLRPNIESLKETAADAHFVRNVCILAHVDHGKTTIADSLLAINGIVSKRSAGQVRYLDDRLDEQERGITMKSSAVSLCFPYKNQNYILNLVDTPGHIDFSTEVATTVRICDGALIIVDVIEGVCVQTKDAIKQAYDEQVKMILVINKIDRLMVELRKSVDEIFHYILRVIEDCNVTIAELCSFDLENDLDEEELLFSPPKGNVIFASALDGWGITTKEISEMFYDIVLGETSDSLNEKMWNFDYYIDASSKKVNSGGIEKKKENLFMQLFLKTIHYVYFTLVLRMDREKLDTIIKKLKIRSPTREMRHNDCRVQVKAILQSWSPLASVIVKQCVTYVPSPYDISPRKIRHLALGSRYFENPLVNDCCEKMMNAMKGATDPPLSIAYITKMFSVDKKNLSQNKPKIFVLPRPREEDRSKKESQGVTPVPVIKTNTRCDEGVVEAPKLESVIIGLCRIFSGRLSVGQEINYLSDAYVPGDKFESNSDKTRRVIIKELYILLGRELVLTDSVSFGNICGVGQIDDVVIRTGTLSSTLNALPLTEYSVMEPIVRNTIEPSVPKDISALHDALKKLTQSDSCVQVVMQGSGEHVLVTAGDVHLAKCLEDLNKFIDFEINVSKPTVSLRETIVTADKTIDLKDQLGCVDISVPEFGIEAKFKAVPLPDRISNFIKINYDIFRIIEQFRQQDDAGITKHHCRNREKIFQDEYTQNLVTKLREQLIAIFKSEGGFWEDLPGKIWSVNKTENGINLLFNNTGDYENNIFIVTPLADRRTNYDHCFVNGFEMCCRAGPICEEPMINCAFFVDEYVLNSKGVQSEAGSAYSIVVANIALAVKNGLKRAFEMQTQRLLEPMFITDIQVNTSILGKVYSVVNKRHGKVLKAIGMDDKEKTLMVTAQIPVIESDGFANEIRKTTSGQANPNLRFSHYEIIDGDPYWEDSILEDDDDPVAIRANRLMKEVRKRKGLLVDEQVVIHAEKQRTLNKKK